eukprot:1997622-Heterocapsa_arctica.AAC.1
MAMAATVGRHPGGADSQGRAALARTPAPRSCRRTPSRSYPAQWRSRASIVPSNTEPKLSSAKGVPRLDRAVEHQAEASQQRLRAAPSSA